MSFLRSALPLSKRAKALHVDLDVVRGHLDADFVFQSVFLDEVPYILGQRDLQFHLLDPRIVRVGRCKIGKRCFIFHGIDRGKGVEHDEENDEGEHQGAVGQHPELGLLHLFFGIMYEFLKNRYHSVLLG